MSAKKKVTLHQRLVKIQQTLKAPKSQFNSFGKYNYRNCEDILEAVKPLLGELRLTISDEVMMVGERYYIKATAKLWDASDMYISASAYAREPENKKGMDEAQISGATSSYARKYALNGLFILDDSKDADTQKAPVYEISTADVKSIHSAKDLESLKNICTSIKKMRGAKYQKSILAHYNARKEKLNESA